MWDDISNNCKLSLPPCDTVSAELCKKRRLNQGFPTVGDAICGTRRVSLACLWRLTSSPSNSCYLPTLNRRRLLQCTSFAGLQARRIYVAHSWAVSTATWSPHQSPLLCLLGSSLFVLPHPANSKQQGRLLHSELPKSYQDQGSEHHLFRWHLATALTCSCRHTEHKPWYGCKSSSEQPNGPLLQKVCKISFEKNIKFTTEFSDT